MEKQKLDDSIFRILSIYYLLYQGGYTVAEIVDELSYLKHKTDEKKVIEDIEFLKKTGVKIEKFKLGAQETYRINKIDDNEIKFTRNESKILNDVKKLLINRKNYDNIQRAMKLLYKVAFFVKDEEKRETIADFGYFSTLNWFLISKLKQHCKNNDIISLDYIVPDGTNRYVTFHCDSLFINPNSNRLYLKGIYIEKKPNQFSVLPIDRIFMIRKVIQEKAPFNMHLRVLNYKISRKLFEKIELDKQEKVLVANAQYVTIQRPIDDEFKIIQKLLSYCPYVYEINDEGIKNSLIEKLEVLKANYGKN